MIENELISIETREKVMTIVKGVAALAGYDLDEAYTAAASICYPDKEGNLINYEKLELMHPPKKAVVAHVVLTLFEAIANAYTDGKYGLNKEDES